MYSSNRPRILGFSERAGYRHIRARGLRCIRKEVAMFDGLLITKNEIGVKRGLLTFPLALMVQVSIVAGCVLWGVFSGIELPPPSSIPIFSAPVAVVPPPPAGNPGSTAKAPKVEKAAVAAKTDPKDLVEPQKEAGMVSATSVDDGSVAEPGEGVVDGVIDSVTSYDGSQPEDPGQGVTRKIFNTGDVVAPRLIFSPPPEYPSLALRLGIRGKVDVELVVDENGNVESVTILSSTNKMFENSVVTALKRWRFTPPVDCSGQKVAVYYRKSIAFSF